MLDVDPSLDRARELDAADPLRAYRERFHIPARADGTDSIYLCGNSLGLQPRSVRELIDEELGDWARLAVDAHFDGTRPWYPYHEQFREIGARLVGARPGEVVMMNSLTVNLHLMMVSFYRPTSSRFKVLIESPAFPSDRYAVESHLRARDVDPKHGIIEVAPREGKHAINEDDIERAIKAHRDSLALILMGGVNYYTGQAFDMARITEHAHRAGAMAGFDLAHAAGNIVLDLHDWDVDFACWCSYKYLNSGPGAVAGCFVHERHGKNLDLPRFAGWWGNDPETRFRMHLEREFTPRGGADGWQISNPPILALAPVLASLEIFDEAGMTALRAKSEQLTPYLRGLIESHSPDWFEIITPRDLRRHGCQLSMFVHDRPRERFESLQRAGVVCDFRPPGVIRIAPVPLYNTFEDCWRFAQALAAID